MKLARGRRGSRVGLDRQQSIPSAGSNIRRDDAEVVEALAPPERIIKKRIVGRRRRGCARPRCRPHRWPG